MRGPFRSTTAMRAVAVASVLALAAACSGDGEDGEVEVADGVDDQAADDGNADDGNGDDGPGDDGDDEPTDDGGADDAGERPESDFAVAEAQREEVMGNRSELGATGTIGSDMDRIGELESAYDATETEDQETQLTVPDDVLFDFDSDQLLPEASEVLDDIAQIIEHYEGAGVHIRGHTDNIGSDAYNQDLSERRAQAVGEYLVAQAGVDQARLSGSGAGASEPVAPNTNDDGSDNPEGRAQNRRVEILIDA